MRNGLCAPNPLMHRAIRITNDPQPPASFRRLLLPSLAQFYSPTAPSYGRSGHVHGPPIQRLRPVCEALPGLQASGRAGWLPGCVPAGCAACHPVHEAAGPCVVSLPMLPLVSRTREGL
jgi:hypothetical protein